MLKGPRGHSGDLGNCICTTASVHCTKVACEDYRKLLCMKGSKIISFTPASRCHMMLFLLPQVFGWQLTALVDWGNLRMTSQSSILDLFSTSVCSSNASPVFQSWNFTQLKFLHLQLFLIHLRSKQASEASIFLEDHWVDHWIRPVIPLLIGSLVPTLPLLLGAAVEAVLTFRVTIAGFPCLPLWIFPVLRWALEIRAGASWDNSECCDILWPSHLQ